MTTKIEYQKRKDNGLCLQCGKPPALNKTMCQVCLDKISNRYKKQRELKVCISCECKVEKNLSRCDACLEKQKEISLKRREQKRKNKICLSCNNTAIKSYCSDCLEQRRLIREDRKKNNLCRSCGEQLINGKSRCDKCVDLNKKSTEKLKDDVLKAYGGAFCNCCGETIREFLVVDHINNDGNIHRKTVGNVYRWLRENNFPNGFQILCQNCNWGKRVCGICPHKLEKTDVIAGIRKQKINSSSTLVDN